MKIQVKLKMGINGYYGWEIDADGNEKVAILKELHAMDKLLKKYFPFRYPREAKKSS